MRHSAHVTALKEGHSALQQDYEALKDLVVKVQEQKSEAESLAASLNRDNRRLRGDDGAEALWKGQM